MVTTATRKETLSDTPGIFKSEDASTRSSSMAVTLPVKMRSAKTTRLGTGGATRGTTARTVGGAARPRTVARMKRQMAERDAMGKPYKMVDTANSLGIQFADLKLDHF